MTAVDMQLQELGADIFRTMLRNVEHSCRARHSSGGGCKIGGVEERDSGALVDSGSRSPDVKTGFFTLKADPSLHVKKGPSAEQ